MPRDHAALGRVAVPPGVTRETPVRKTAMPMHTLKRRMSALGAVLGLSVALPFTTGASPAYAAAQMRVTKTHEGNFVRGQQGTYHIEVTNIGDTPTLGDVDITDTLPQGLTFSSVTVNSIPPSGITGACAPVGQTGVDCFATFDAGATLTIDIVVNIAADAPCTGVTNTVRVSRPEENIQVSASDPTTITGSTCPANEGNGGGLIGSLLPVNLNGVLPMFNNISTNNNILSPGGSNATHQNLGINAP
ncbi:hypothetical protein AB0M92_31735 [Streptomyces sp. NPDC051582]|uniref:hypothetical protein n=1 Tax=Streptomyces sp. NPDC051582 TaxID=3155167 RepID=UPI00343CFA6D